MGYSARYHVASLAAVFLALAVGILIGAEFGADVRNALTEDLEESLQEDVADANAEIDALSAELATEREFSEAAYPALVRGVLGGDQIGVVALGSRPDALRDDIAEALEPSGAEVAQVAVVAEPPDLDALAETVGPRRRREVARGGDALRALARGFGRDLVLGVGRYQEDRDALLSGFSGEVVGLDGVLVVRDQPDELTGEERADTEALETGLLEGMLDAGRPVVGVQRSEPADPSMGFLESRGLSTVDNLDQAAGKVALVYALAGAQGNFGVGENADALLPELLGPRGAGGGR